MFGDEVGFALGVMETDESKMKQRVELESRRKGEFAAYGVCGVEMDSWSVISIPETGARTPTPTAERIGVAERERGYVTEYGEWRSGFGR